MRFDLLVNAPPDLYKPEVFGAVTAEARAIVAPRGMMNLPRSAFRMPNGCTSNCMTVMGGDECVNVDFWCSCAHFIRLKFYFSISSTHSGFCFKMTTPSNTGVSGMYFSLANSARSPTESRTGVVWVWKPVIVFGRPAWPTMSTA